MKMEEESKHEPRYGMMLIGIVSVTIMFFVAWNLVMNVSEHSISGMISEVIYKDNGFASDSVKVFFRNQTGFSDTLEINFVADSYYNHEPTGNGLDSVYQLLKSHIGDDVIIEYTKAPIGDIGFVNLEIR